ncbi:MAG: tRNA (guanosine(46)-N7)-methyltransferase TrmB [Chthoniobacterales bacterium]|nr:MAG: tRNA (guanosine(46)-N7)-methyltransferase TrmB [Chthoniobacterales bacterium]
MIVESKEFSTNAGPPEIIFTDESGPLDLRAIYGRSAPLQVDLGCGDGSFLVAAAVANPDRDFLGIERLLGRVRNASRKIELSKLLNARVWRGAISDAVRLLPPNSVEVFYLMFPDPWPKRRHFRRRLVTEKFLFSIHQALVSQGLLRIATDQIDYFRKIELLAAHSPGFITASDEQIQPAPSTFEKRFSRAGAEIYRLVLRKISPVT